jgi:hypothetical protein
VDELGAELLFERGDLFAHRRLANAALLCDGGEAAFLDHPDEHLHRIELVHPSLRIPLRNAF